MNPDIRSVWATRRQFNVRRLLADAPVRSRSRQASGCDRNGTSIINLLPMARKSIKQQHIFLRVATPLTEGWRTFVLGAEKNFA